MIIPTVNDLKTVTDMREDAIGLLNSVKKRKKPTIIMHHNSPKAVMLSVEEYNKLVEALEDYRGELEAINLEKEAKKSTSKDLISLEELTKKHNIKI